MARTSIEGSRVMVDYDGRAEKPSSWNELILLYPGSTDSSWKITVKYTAHHPVRRSRLSGDAAVGVRNSWHCIAQMSITGTEKPKPPEERESFQG
jgi:hypothetical protein